VQDRSRRSHREKGRHSTNREFLKLLVSEELESKQTRRFLRSALARLDNETLRAQEAERRALELAERFKVVNDARLASQQELNRVNEELRLYKVQYDNAQREIHRGQQILKDIEAQRDDAEAAAARARTTARKLKEQQLMMRAREEGRKAGYEEGLRRGLEQARIGRQRSNTEDDDAPPADDGVASLQDTATVASRADPLNDLNMRTFSPAPSVPLDYFPTQTAPPPELSAPQPSRFHEHGIGISPAPTTNTLPNEPVGWPQNPPQVPQADAPSSPKSDIQYPHDGFIPQMGPDGFIGLPTPHNLARPETPSSPMPIPIPPPGPPPVDVQPPPKRQPLAKDYAYVKPSTPSLAESVPSISTTFSQFDMLNTPTTPTSRGAPQPRNMDISGGRAPALSVIHEVASSAEFTPRQSMSFERGSSVDPRSPPDNTAIPEAIVFPGVPTQARSVVEDSPAVGIRSPRSQAESRFLADSLRYGNPEVAESMRRDAAHEVRACIVGSVAVRY
jgi:hypothetical protein